MKVRCRLFGHDWRPDQIHLFGVCRHCPAAKAEPHPFQISMDLPIGGNWEGGFTDRQGGRWTHVPWRGWQRDRPWLTKRGDRD